MKLLIIYSDFLNHKHGEIQFMFLRFLSLILLFFAIPLFSDINAKLIYSSYFFQSANINNELSPFSGAQTPIRLHEGAKVKILDEFETASMIGNILQIEIADKKKGYIEKNAVIPEEYSDTAFYTNKKIGNLPANSVVYFKYSSAKGLHFRDKNNNEIILDNLENVRFVLNRRTENRYRNKHNTIIVKVADTHTLRPISNAKLDGFKTDSDGYCYLDLNESGKSFSLTCDGYESQKITVDRKINLFFLSRLSYESHNTNDKQCSVKMNIPADFSQIYFRPQNSFNLYSTKHDSVTLPQGKYEIIYEDIEGGFYPIQQFVNLRSDNVQIYDLLKNINHDRSNISWRNVPISENSNGKWKILFSKGENITRNVSSLKYELVFSDCNFNFYRNEMLVAGGYFVRHNENIRLHWNFGYDMQASLFSCGVVITGEIHENIGTEICEFQITSKRFEPKVAEKIKMPWLPDIFNEKNILFIKQINQQQ